MNYQIETRSMAARRREQQQEVISEYEDANEFVTAAIPSSQNTFETSAVTVVSPLQTTVNRSGSSRGVKSVSSRASAASSKRVQRMKERLKLEEEAIRMELRLNQNRRHQLTLQEEADDAEDWSDESITDQKEPFVSEWVDQQAKINRQTTVDVKEQDDNPQSAKPPIPKPRLRSIRNEQEKVKVNPTAFQEMKFPPPPPLYQFIPGGQSQMPRGQNEPLIGSRITQPVPPPPENPPPPAPELPVVDPVSQLTEALKAVMLQPQQQMEKYLARQTLGRDLPPFNGDVEDWPSFISYFTTSTRECDINSSQNLVRLQKCLKGRARESVRALLVSEKNVGEIIRVLEKEFGHPTVIIRSLMDKARRTTPPTEESFESIVQFGGCVRNLVKTIESLGKVQYLQNPQLLEELEDKLPSHLRLQWAQVVVNFRPFEPTLSHFSKWLESVTDAAIVLKRTAAAPADEKEEKQETSKSKPKGKGGGRHRDTTLSTSEGASKTCTYCSISNHDLLECRKFKKLKPKERIDWTRKSNHCFLCLKPNHRASSCWSKKSCGKDGCTLPHHPLLHLKMEKEEQPPQKDETEAEEKAVEHNGHINSVRRSVLLRVAPVLIQGPKGELETFALCDEASTVSLIDNKVAVQLGMEGPVDPLHLSWTDDSFQEDNSSRRVPLKIRGKNGEKLFTMQNVRTVKNLSLPVQSCPARTLLRKLTYIKDVSIDNYVNAKPTILIGQDHIHLIIARDVQEGPPNSPVASRTKLGWILHGNLGSHRGRVEPHYSFCAYDKSAKNDARLDELMKETFSLDSIGIMVNPNNLKSREDLRAEDLMNRFTKRIEGRFETGLIWRADEPRLPNNQSMALKRLHSIERKMDQDPAYSEEYVKKVEHYVQMGYARKLEPQEADKITAMTWYLPHFFAFHPNKPGKPRFVFDAAAEYRGQSLNSNLIAGPDVLKSLPGILLKFREKKVAFTADIREMFHQVWIRDEDQDAQRFLWRGIDRTRSPDTYVMCAMIFGASCSPYAAQFVKNKNAMEFKDEYPEAVNSIINHHYVDDLADGADDEEMAWKMIQDIIYVHAQGGFEIGKWCCSSKDVLHKIPPELRGSELKELDSKSDIPIERVLGLRWDPNQDTFQFSTNFNKVDPDVISGKRMPTKREVLKTIMSVFDPLGFLSPYIIQAKILYQNIWRSEIEWDDAILVNHQHVWEDWRKQIPLVAELSIPRYYFAEGKNEDLELHVFCDASSEAYAAVAYLRSENGSDINVKMIMAKARVTPLKPQSIPRLELQSALMAVRLAAFIKEEQNLKFSSEFFWTDSKTVELWLRADAYRFKQFVAHRVGEIHEKSDVKNWRWLPSKMNPADIATRSQPKMKLDYDSVWYGGPNFLLQPKQEWKFEKPKKVDLNVEDLEIKKEFSAVIQDNIVALPNINHFSKWSRVVRATAWIRRYISNLKARARQEKIHVGELTVEDIKWAEIKWWIQVQQESFPNEVENLKKGLPVARESKIKFLSPFIDIDGVIRVSSRTIRSPELNEEQKVPVILDPAHRYTQLLIMEYHEKALHQGQEFVVNELRQRFWILKMRAAVKSCWNSCIKCRQRSSKPLEPEIAPLPAFRLTPQVRPFTICGLDYFGPLTVSKFRRHEKRWGALFTCMHTRAVHLELVDNLSTDSVIMAMMRMASVRGWPQKFYSDNGTNFRGAVTELNRSIQQLNQDKLMGELALKKVEWHFIPPYAAHFGGAWERLVRSVKRALEVIVKEQSPKEETMRTLFAEAMGVVNSRPLTYVPSDKDDPEVLTPNSFLIGTTSTCPLLGEFEDRDICMKKQWRYAQRLADHFWKRWVHEYLPTLTRKQKWTKEAKQVKIGDVVVIVDDNLPRNVWPKGLIVQVYPGKDNVVRVADVKTKGGVFRRPVTKLCVLYCGEEDKGIPSI